MGTARSVSPRPRKDGNSLEIHAEFVRLVLLIPGGEQ